MWNKLFAIALFLPVLACLNHHTAAQSTGRVCTPGQFRDSNDKCQRCPENTYSNIANAPACKPCPHRRVSPAGSNAVQRCEPCGSGRFFDTTAGKPVCRRCPEDTFNNKADAIECKPCPDGKVSSIGATTKKQCRTCPAGTVVFRNRNIIVQCRECPDGQSTFEENALACSGCPKGTFRDRFSPGTGCQPCRPGTFADEAGLTKCKSCQKGFFQAAMGAAKCDKCPKDSDTAGTGAKSCRPTCLPDSPGCSVKACLPGFGLNSATQECEECPPGQISPTLSTTPCFPCPIGDGTVNTARTKCVCQPGFKLRRDGTCERCPSGFSNEDGSQCMCVLNTDITDSCTCSPLSKQVGNKCVSCNPRFDPRCNSCSSGEFYAKMLRRCETCPANTTSAKNGRGCVSCPGDSTSMPGDFGCLCKAGEGLQDGMCKPCPPGSFSRVKKSFRNLRCSKCFSGFSDVFGATKCKKCPRNLTPTKGGATSCLGECPQNAKRFDLPFEDRCTCISGFKNTGSDGELKCTRE